MPDTNRLPGAQAENWDWQLAAACRETSSPVFPNPAGEGNHRRACLAREAAAKQLCGQCRVQQTCLQFALQTREPYGVWGGYTPAERETLRQRRQARGG